MKLLRFHESAVVEMEDALNWQQRRSETSRERLREELSIVLDRISQNPLQFPSHISGAHRAVLGRFPYCFIFLDEPERIFVVALAHAKRSPGYWTDRL